MASGRGRAARQERHRRLRRGLGERRGSAGADQKPRPGLDRFVDLLTQNDSTAPTNASGMALAIAQIAASAAGVRNVTSIA